MASLALLVSLIFIIVLLIGPLSYVLSLFDWMPRFIVWVLGLSCIFVGIWWFLLPIPAIRYYGLVDVFIGLKIVLGSSKKKLKVDKTDNR